MDSLGGGNAEELEDSNNGENSTSSNPSAPVPPQLEDFAPNKRPREADSTPSLPPEAFMSRRNAQLSLQLAEKEKLIEELRKELDLYKASFFDIVRNKDIGDILLHKRHVSSCFCSFRAF